MYYVSRQYYYYSGLKMVEIAYGGCDYANADQLVTKYGRLGEGKEFLNPKNAVEAAIDVRDEWQKDSKEKINISLGSTKGFSMEFEPMTDEELIEKAQKLYDGMDKCEKCGDLLEETYFSEYLQANFCSTNCLEKAESDENKQYMEEFDSRENIHFVSGGHAICPECKVDWGDDGDCSNPDCDANREAMDERWFSWRSCECCHSGLGGNRYKLSARSKEDGDILMYDVCEDCYVYWAS